MPHIIPWATPAGIAAHACFRPVGIEDAHGEVGYGRPSDEHQPVAPDAEVRATPCLRATHGVGQAETCGIDIDVVVARTLHFGEFYFHIPITDRRLRARRPRHVRSVRFDF